MPITARKLKMATKHKARESINLFAGALRATKVFGDNTKHGKSINLLRGGAACYEGVW
jgi:hypothetical protein